jgi:hypothetical protein
VHIYIEKIHLFNLTKVFSFISSGKHKNIEEVFYIDITHTARYLLMITSKINGIIFSKLSFRMLDIKDKNELMRARIHTEDIFRFQTNIYKHQAYESYISDELTSKEAANYINTGLTYGTIAEKSIARGIYIIEVINWFMSSKKQTNSILFMEDLPWSLIYKELGHEKNIKIIFYSALLGKLHIKSILQRLRRIPIFFLIGKYLKHFEASEIFSLPKRKKQFNMFVFGRGDINLKNNGLNSDFFWHLNSSYPAENIVYQYNNKSEKNKLLKNGIIPLSGSPLLKDIFNIKHKIKLKKYDICKSEYLAIKRITDSYNSNYNYWRSLFKKHQTKIYLTWYKYDNNYMVASNALRSLGGITAVWQIAFDGFKSLENRLDTDIVFSWSHFSTLTDQELGSDYRYNIIIGYPKDYTFNVLKNDAAQLRKKILSNGAKNIVCIFDENSTGDSRWHTGHELQEENYSFILEELLSNPQLGVIFKPKTFNTLHRRLKNIKELLLAAEETGRCHIFKESGRHTTLAPPILGALASDVCVHGHLGAGSAAVESALAGIPTLLIDREGFPRSKLNQLNRGKVIFNDWPETILALREYFLSNRTIEGFGDWSKIKDDLDPFNDGLGAYRMGEYLHWLMKDLNRGIHRKDAMKNAAQLYTEKWGKDKIIIN